MGTIIIDSKCHIKKLRACSMAIQALFHAHEWFLITRKKAHTKMDINFHFYFTIEMLHCAICRYVCMYACKYKTIN